MVKNYFFYSVHVVKFGNSSELENWSPGRKFRCNFVPLYIGPVLYINLIATGLKTILHMLGSLL